MRVWQCLIANKEIINMFLQALLALAGCMVVVSLFFHRKAVLLQKDGIQATMFSEISGRLSTILGQTPSKNDDAIDVYNWYVRLFNEFEAIIFLVRNKCMNEKMEGYFQSFIIAYIEKLPEHFPNAIKEFGDLPVGAYGELRSYYKNVTGKHISYFPS